MIALASFFKPIFSEQWRSYFSATDINLRKSPLPNPHNCLCCPLRRMMTPSNGIIFIVIGPLCGEFIGHRWIPHTKNSDAEIWCFLWSAPWITGWVNNHGAGDFRCHLAHYDVILRHRIVYVAHCVVVLFDSCICIEWNTVTSSFNCVRRYPISCFNHHWFQYWLHGWRYQT